MTREQDREALAVALDRLAFYMSAALSGEVPDDETVSEDREFAREARALAGVGFRPALEDEGRLDPDLLWRAVIQHVGIVPVHQHDRAETCGEVIAREYAAGVTFPQDSPASPASTPPSKPPPPPLPPRRSRDH